MSVYAELVKAGLSDESASLVAKAVDSADLVKEMHRLDIRLEKIEGDIRTLKWMTGTNVIVSIGILIRLTMMQ